MSMAEATVEGGFGPTRRVPGDGRAAAEPRRAVGSTRLHLDADRRHRLAAVAQALLQVRDELAQLGRDRRVAAQQRPALVVDRAGAHLRGQPERQCRDDRVVELAGPPQPLREPAERSAFAERLGDRHRRGRRSGLGWHRSSLAGSPADKIEGSFAPSGLLSACIASGRPHLESPPPESGTRRGRSPAPPRRLLRPAMLPKLLTSIFGSRNDRLLKQYRHVVQKVNAFEPAYEQLSDTELRAKTEEFRSRHANGETLDALLPEAFAAVREASKRTLKMRHFDVQLIGGMVLHAGKIAEMRTGEGKTLVATLPVYLNSLAGKGVHVVTVNDYLARRDAEWMGKLYTFLGLSVGVNLPQMAKEDKQAAYAADVTYGTNNEFGFDYLRDNMVQDVADRVARGLSYAIVDEVDSILIDEARTPLIISGQAEDHTELYVRINAVVPKLKKQIGELDIRTGEGVIDPGDFTVDEKTHQVFLTEEGHENAE